jgi:hypothetical protein
MRKILTALVALVSLLATVPLVAPADGTTTTTLPTASVYASVSVGTSCDITAGNINFGTLYLGDISSSDVTSTISMPKGNAEVTPEIKGNDWTPSMGVGVGQTHWSTISGQDYTTGMTALTSSDGVSLGKSVKHGTDLPVYFKLAIPAGQTAGTSYTQTITFTVGC